MRMKVKSPILILITILLVICMIFSFLYVILNDGNRTKDSIKYEKASVEGLIRIYIYEKNNQPKADKKALKSYINRFDFKIKNNTKKEESFHIALDVNKLSTINIKNIKYVIKEKGSKEEKKLKMLSEGIYQISPENKNILFNKYKKITIDSYLLEDDIVIKSNEEKEYSLYLWIKEGSKIKKKDFFEAFIVIN
ncbi:MAG: hypothetical protein GX951_03840 [Mollicutes bacterium]|nr:hypothetical protein [Mollicutes bacterium]